jgi:hypothetical protein
VYGNNPREIVLPQDNSDPLTGNGACSRGSGEGSAASCSIDEFSQYVHMSGVATSLFDHVGESPPH